MPFDSAGFIRTVQQEADLELLREARARVAKRWIQDQYSVATREGWAYCMVGAVGPGFDAATTATRLLLPHLPHEPGRRFDSVEAWNDTLGRTKEEVLAVYDKAIAVIEETSHAV